MHFCTTFVWYIVYAVAFWNLKVAKNGKFICIMSLSFDDYVTFNLFIDSFLFQRVHDLFMLSLLILFIFIFCGPFLSVEMWIAVSIQ